MEPLMIGHQKIQGTSHLLGTGLEQLKYDVSLLRNVNWLWLGLDW